MHKSFYRELDMIEVPYVLHQALTQQDAKLDHIIFKERIPICFTHSLYIINSSWGSHDQNYYLTIHKASSKGLNLRIYLFNDC